MKTLKIIAAITATAIAAMAGCNKENPDPGSGYMAVQMSGSEASSGSGDEEPSAPYSVVYVDIRSVEVHHSNPSQDDGDERWISLTTKAGIYDLLTLKSDITASLVEDTKIPAGYITQLRMVLGPNNSVVVNGGAQYVLKVPSGTQTGIKVNLNTRVENGKHLSIALDFNAEASIVNQGNGSFSLQPVIRLESITEKNP